MAGGSPGAAGVGANEAPHADIEIVGTTQNQGSVVEVKVRETIDLTLQTIGPGEYGDPQLSSTAVSFDAKGYAPLPNPAGPRQIYRFRAESPGMVTLTIPHTSDPTAFTLTFHVS